MKRTVSICLLSVFLALFGMTLETKAQGGCCLWLENVDPTMPAWQAATLKAPSYRGVDVYEVKFSNGCALDLNTKISLAWTLTKDGDVLNVTQQELEMFVKIKLETTYDPVGRIGGYLHNGISYKRVPAVNNTTVLGYQDYPGALTGSQIGGPDHGYWTIGNDVYHYDYMYLHYFMASHTYVTLEWIQPGNYTLSVSMVGRTLGTDWSDLYYDATQTMVLGGHNSTVRDTIATFELKPVTEVEVDTFACKLDLPFALGRPPLYFYGDTTGAMVPLWIDEACHLMDSVLKLNLTTINADPAPNDTLFYFCQNEIPSDIAVELLPGRDVQWSVDGINWTDTLPIPRTDVVGTDTIYAHQARLVTDPLCWSAAAIVEIVTLEPTPRTTHNGRSIELCVNDSVAPLNYLNYPATSTDYFIEYSDDNINWDTVYRINTTVADTFFVYVRQTDTTGFRRCPSSPSDTILVYVKHLPVYSMVDPFPNDTVCDGDLITIDFFTIPANTYSWIPQDGTVNSYSTVDTIRHRMTLGKPAGSYYYTAHVVDSVTGCVINDSILLTWNPLPKPEIILIDTNWNGGLCERDSSRMTTAIHYAEYEWKFNGDVISTADTIMVRVAGKYTVYVKYAVGCEGRDTRDLLLDPLPPVDDFLLHNPDICSGAPVELEIICTGCPAIYTYLWNTTETTNPITVVVENNTISPFDTTFTVVITNSITGCALDTFKILTVHPNPIATIDPTNVAVCKEDIKLFTGSDDRAYSDATTVTFAWTSVNGTPSTSTDTIYAVSFATPTVTLPEIVKLKVENNWGCVDSTTTTVTVEDSINIAISANPATICEGDSSLLFVYVPNPADDAANTIISYEWSNGATTAETWVKPNDTTTYTVIVTFAERACPSRATVTVNVNPMPQVTISTSPTLDSIMPAIDTVCYMSNLKLWANLHNGTGGYGSNYEYQWSGYTTSDRDTVTVLADHPGEIMDFNVVVTNKITGCISITHLQVYVRPQVAPSLYLFQAPNTNACSGITIKVYPNVTGTGYSYLWNAGPSITPIASDTVAITHTTLVDTTFTISLTITDLATGCSNATSRNITFYALPIADIVALSDSVCEGSTTIISTNSGHNQYNWRVNGVADNTLNNRSTFATPAITADVIYCVSIYSNRGCVKDTCVSITMIPTPVAEILSNPCDTVFEGEGVTLTATDAATVPYHTFAWSNGSVLDTMQFVASTTATYTVTITENQTSQRCSVVGTKTITVDPLTPHDGVRAIENCSGVDTLIGFEEDAYTYSWRHSGDTTNLITVNPVNNTSAPIPVVYYVEISKTGGCYIRLDSITVTVLPLPDVSLTVNPCDTIFQGTNVTITAVNDPQYAYAWSEGAVTNLYEITVAPDTTHAYTLTITNRVTGCVRDTTVVIAVLPVTPIGDGRFVDNCSGVNVEIGFTQTEYEYVWDGGLGNTPTITVAPTVTTTYYVTITKVGSCAASKRDSIVVTVLPLPVDVIETLPTPTTTVCQNDSLTLALTNNELAPAAPRTVGDWYATLEGTTTPVYYFQTGGDTLRLDRVDTLPAGNYNFMVDLTNALGCERTDTLKLEVVAKPLVDAPAATLHVACADETVVLDFTASSDFSSYTTLAFSQVGGANVAETSPFILEVDITAFYNNNGVNDTTYVTTTVANTAFCETVRIDTIIFYPLPFVTPIAIEGNAVGDLKVCGDDEATVFVNFITDYTYSWSVDGSAPVVGTDSSFVVDVTLPGTYDIELIVTSPEGCTDTVTATIQKFEIPEVKITSPSIYLNDTTLAISCIDPIVLTANAINSPAPGTGYEFTWTNAVGTIVQGPTLITTIFGTDTIRDVYSYSTPGRDTITVTVTDPTSGCQVTASQIVLIDSMPLIDITNVIRTSTNEIIALPLSYTAIYEKDGVTGTAIDYDVVVNKRCWNGYNKVVLNFEITDTAGNIVDFGDIFSSDNSISYRFNNLAGDYTQFMNYNNQPSAIFRVPQTSGSLPMGGADVPAANKRYILNNLPYNWLYLHFLDQRPMTVINNYFRTSGDYTVTYTLWEYPLDHVANQHNIEYTVGTPKVYVGGAATLVGSPHLLATRTIVLHITGPDMVPNAIDAYDANANSVKPTAHVYPNPAQDEVNIEVKDYNGAATFGIYDLNGRLINQFDANVANGQVINHNVSAYSDGVYFIKISTPEAIINKKLVITK
ncbi:MAG: T9SS type A sorting domain-containing protein [Bacteroidales bacterium]|jgi:hypothetical protein|nr:T9SS type A sorting domain-containing protein [Bacteroidales bacterium]